MSPQLDILKFLPPMSSSTSQVSYEEVVGIPTEGHQTLPSPPHLILILVGLIKDALVSMVIPAILKRCTLRQPVLPEDS